jgi:RHS repeat-associated protein
MGSRLVGYQYDAAGNLTFDGSHSYTYDAENRITKVDGGATATYVYDALGHRVRKTTGGGSTDYIYNSEGNVVAEWGPGCGSVCWTVGYIYFGGSLLAQYQSSTTYFVRRDDLGSTRLLTKVDQSIYDSVDYLPYGEQIAGDTGTTHKFTGKERDSESGLDNFTARYFASTMGRFMTPDWAARPTTVPYAVFGDPQSLNLYTYVRNDPVTRPDADGHCDAPTGLKPGQVGVCVASYIKTKWFHFPGRGDGRNTNPRGGTSRVETRLVVDPKQHTATQTYDHVGRSGIVGQDFGLKGSGGSTVSKPTVDDKGDTHFQVAQHGESAMTKTGLIEGTIDNHVNLDVSANGQPIH